jgi:tetratricopeptide (TPR) repeat protein
MPEGLLSGLVGEEDDKHASIKAGPEALVAAVAANTENQNPEVIAETVALFREQRELLIAQRKTVETEHEFFEREWRPRLFGMRLRAAFQVFFALVATVLGLGGAMMIRDAVTSHRVIVDPFHAPPPLEARGIDGAVVASGLLDELSRLQDATRSTVQKLDQSNGWSSQVKLEVPETGISLGELSRLLKERFGHDVHIEGDLIETPPGGLALTVRGSGVPANTFEGSATELGKLTTQAAEYVYAKSQPARWAYYLQNAGRSEEAIAFCRSTFGSASAEDRPYLLNVWANSINNTGGSIDEALGLYRAALKLKPDYWAAHNNVMNSLWIKGKEEEAWHAGEELRKVAGGRPGRAPEIMYTNPDTLTWNLGPWLDATLADAAASEMEAFAAAYANPIVATSYPGYRCWIAPAEEAAGHPEKADALLRSAGTYVDCYRFRADILDGRGDWSAAQKAYADAVALAPDLPAGYYSWGVALAKHGDLAGAVVKLTAANQRGPHWADPLNAWGDVLMKQSNAKDALAKYDEALKYAPNWKQLKEARESAAKLKT